jgi:hypothetical protein
MKLLISRNVPIAKAATRQAIKEALLELVAGQTGEDPSLSAAAGAAPEAVRVAVPVVLDTDARTAPYDGDIAVTLRARSNAGFFPTFSGTIGVEENGLSHSRVSLRGSYQAPLGVMGAAIDAVALRGVARSSLERMLDALIHRAVERIDAESSAAYVASRSGFGR